MLSKGYISMVHVTPSNAFSSTNDFLNLSINAPQQNLAGVMTGASTLTLTFYSDSRETYDLIDEGWSPDSKQPRSRIGLTTSCG